MIPSALDCGTVRQSRFTTGNAFARMTAEYNTSTHLRKREPQRCNMADWIKCPAVESNPPKIGRSMGVHREESLQRHAV